MSSKPSIVLVPGAWFPGEAWSKVTAILESHGHSCVPITLPSAKSNPEATFLDDVQAVRNAIEGETIKGQDVIVVVHSYGALPGHSAAKGLTPRQGAPDKTGSVIGFAMMATGFTATGVAFLDGVGGPPPVWKINKETGFVEMLFDAKDLFFADLPLEEGRYWAGQLGQQSLKALAEGGEHAYATWMEVPSWYLATKQDVGLPVESMTILKASPRFG